jgi:hypothetical protein
MNIEKTTENALRKTIGKKAIKEEAHVGHEEFSSMKKGDYKSDADLDSYVIQNKKTNKIVEIKAVSAFQASKLVGWRPRHTKLIQVNTNSSEE